MKNLDERRRGRKGQKEHKKARAEQQRGVGQQADEDKKSREEQQKKV